MSHADYLSVSFLSKNKYWKTIENVPTPTPAPRKNKLEFSFDKIFILFSKYLLAKLEIVIFGECRR